MEDKKWEKWKEVEDVCDEIVATKGEPMKMVDPITKMAEIKHRDTGKFKKTVPKIEKWREAAKAAAPLVLARDDAIKDRIESGEYTKKYGNELLKARKELKKRKEERKKKAEKNEK